jgi:rubrerythrin
MWTDDETNPSAERLSRYMGVRSTKRESLLQRARSGAAAEGFGRIGRSEQRERPQRRFASTESVASGSAPAARHRLHHDPVQDTAVYNCSCGFVFEADVQTTVGCPHCGAEQAW